MNEAPEWLRKTVTLLNHHHIYPLDTGMMFVVQMGRADQKRVVDTVRQGWI